MGTVLYALGKALLVNFQPTAARTTSTSGSGKDLRDYHGTAAVVLDSGAGGAGGTLDVTFEESDDNSTWADVPAAAFDEGTNFTQVGNAASQQVRHFNVGDRKRYMREKHVIGGSGNFTYSVNFLGQKQYS